MLKTLIICLLVSALIYLFRLVTTLLVDAMFTFKFDKALDLD